MKNDGFFSMEEAVWHDCCMNMFRKDGNRLEGVRIVDHPSTIGPFPKGGNDTGLLLIQERARETAEELKFNIFIL